MQKIHTMLLKNNKTYAKWHNNPLSNFTHFSIFIITALLLTSAIQNQALAVNAVTVGGPSTLDIVFIGDNYDASEMGKFHSDVERFKTHLLSFEPFKSRASQITFDYVDNTSDLGCYGQRLLVCNSNLTNLVKASGKTYDQVVVLVDTSIYGGSGNPLRSYTSAYNGSSGPGVFVHEFGHKFGGLADEYNRVSGADGNEGGASTIGTIRLNCATTNNKSQWANFVPSSDYNFPCTVAGEYSSSPSSIMRSVSTPYFNAISQQSLNAKIDYVVNNGAFSGPNSWSNIDTIAPTVGVITTSGTTGIVNVSAPMSDNYGVAYYQLWVDGVLKQVAYSGNSFNWNSATVANGNHTLQIKAYDTAVRVGVSPLKSIVTNNDTIIIPPTVTTPTNDPASPDTTAPTVSLTSPVDGSTLDSSIILSADASDNIGVTKVEFYLDNAKVYTDTSEPFASSNLSTASVTNGTHIFKAKAYDSAGNVSTAEATVTKGVTSDSTSTPTPEPVPEQSPISDPTPTPAPASTPAPIPDTAPVVAIVTPSNGDSVSGVVTILVNASDDVSISKVELYVGSARLGSPDTTAPYSFSVNTTNAKNTSYTLTAKAYDNTGNMTTSDAVTVSVSNILNTSNVFDAINNWFKKIFSKWWK